VTRRKERYAVAFLAGDGIGAELTAAASRALQEASRLHGFAVDEVHAPFGGEALARFGHRLPEQTRAAYRDADAILVAATRDPALEGVKADLDLTWRVQRVRFRGGDVAIVSPLVDEAEPLAVGRAFELALARRARVATVGDGRRWSELVAGESDLHPGLDVRHLSLEQVLPELLAHPENFCVLVTQRVFADAVSDMAAYGMRPAPIVASGRLSESGAGVFGPTHGSAPGLAGLGVANPSGILLAAALLLGEGLGRRPAAQTLELAVSGAIGAGVRTPDLAGRATTRDFSVAVLALMPSVRQDVEFGAEVPA
jgi:3-isopropylmalate dehydrogenase